MIKTNHRSTITPIFPTIVFLLVLLISSAFAQESDLVPYDKSAKTTRSLSDFNVHYLEDIQGVSVFDFTGNYDKNINGNPNSEARQAVLQEFYLKQKDIYDFVYIFTEFQFDTEGASAFASPIINDTTGLGKPLFDVRDLYFNEKLQSVIDMNFVGNWIFNPANRKFDGLLDLMMHETMHRWGINIKYIDGSNQVSDRLLGRDASHWSYFLNSNASVMYGSDWEETQTSHFITRDRMHGLSPLDLYLAGFLGKESVGDFFVITNANSGVNTDLPPFIGTEIIGNKEIISIDDIIAYEGERVPNHLNAQHQFKVKFILLKSVDEEINTQTIANIYVLQNEFQKRFFAETNGIGRIILPTNLSDIESANPQVLAYNPQLNAAFNLQSAVDFILANPKDWWQDASSTSVRDTVAVINSLQLIIDDFPALQNKLTAAILWLNNHQPQNNDERAWMLSSGVLNNDIKQQIMDATYQAQLPTGGWGLDNSAASPYDTALVINGFAQAQGNNFNLNVAGTQYVLENINPDSGFSYVAGGQSSVVSSARLLRSLAKISTDPQHVDNLVDFILSKKLPDNSFGGNGEGTPHETALVIKALEALDNSNQTRIDLAKAALNTMQSIDGSMQGSYYSTALAISVFNANTKANLKFDNVSVSNDHPIAGENILINLSVRNTGAVDAGPSEVTLYRNSIEVNNQLGQMPIATLAYDQTVTAEILVDTTGFAFSTPLLAVIDVNNSVNESNENDNVFGVQLNVQQPGDTPELAFDAGGFSIDPVQFETLPLTINASATVSNLSLTAATNVVVNLAKIDATGEHIVLASQSMDIAQQSSQQYIFSAEISQANLDIPLIFTIDPDNAIAEVNEENNTYSTVIRKIQSVDLTIIPQDLNIPNQVAIGNNLTAMFNINNIGTEIASSFSAKIYADLNASSQLIFEAQISQLGAGQRLNREFSWAPQVQGDYTLRFILDEVNELAEIDETNNEISIPIQVVANVLGNLSIDTNDVSINPDPGLQGQNLQFNLNVHNNSSIDSGLFDISIFQQMAIGTPNLEIASLTTSSGVLANSTKLIQFDLPATELVGQHSYVFSIDSNDTIPEFDENDNLVIKDFRVLSKPDALVSAGGFQLTPSVPVLGEPLTVDVTVSNKGEQDISQLDVSLYYDNSQQSSPVLVQTQSLSSILAQQSQSVAFVFNFPNDVAIDSLTVKVDESQNINEGNENNNDASIIVGNQDSVLYVTQKFFSPNSDGVKDQTTIVFNVETISNYQIEVVDTDLNLIKTFDANLFQNTSFGDVIWNGINNRGVLARDGNYFIRLLDDNAAIIATTLLSLDINKSPLFESMTNNNEHFTDLNCIGDFRNSRFRYSHDGEFIYTSKYKNLSNQQQKGLFRIKTDGSKITPVVPQQFLSGASAFDYNILDNGSLLLTFRQGGVYKLYLKEIDTGSLILLDTVVSSIEMFAYTSTFVILVNHIENKLIKVYFDTAKANEEIQFQGLLSVVHQLNNGLVIFQEDINTDLKDLFFISNDFNQSPLLLAEDLAYEQAFELAKSKNTSKDFNSFVFRKNDIIKIYKTNGAGIDLAFSKQQANKNYGFNSFNELYTLSENQQIEIFNNSGTQVLHSEPTFMLENFDNTLAGIETIAVDLGGEFQKVFNVSEMFDPLLVQELVSATDYTDKKESVLMIKNSLMGQFITPECDDFMTVGCDFGSPPPTETTQAPVVTIYTLVKLDYTNISQLKMQVVEIGQYDFYTTELGFSPVQEGRSNFIQATANNTFSRGLIDRVHISQENQNLNNLLASELKVTFPQSITPINFLKNKQKRIEIFNHVVLRDNNLIVEPICASQTLLPTYIYRSKENAYANITALVQQNGVEIGVTAFDKNFARYDIHWSAQNSAEQWNLLFSSSDTANDGDIVYNWLPNQSGSYNLKLTVFDKAGNTDTDIEQIIINNTSTTIGDINVAPRYFSPNGDGVKDSISIGYEVLAATEVLVQIEDQSGLVVRSFQREYNSPLILDMIQWDGKDQNGLLLEDGQYQVVVQGFRYDAYLDTQAIILAGLEMEYVDGLSSIVTRIKYPVTTAQEELVILEDYSNSRFQFFNTVTGLWQDSGGVPILLNSLNIDTVKAGNYRLRTEDKAGNIGFSAIGLPPLDYWVTSVRKRTSGSFFRFGMHYTSFPDLSINDKFPKPSTAALIVDWDINSKIAYVIQVLNYNDIEFIRFTSRYTDSSTQQVISQSKLVNALLPNQAQNYIGAVYAGSNINGNNIFDVELKGTKIPFLAVELDKVDFPETDEIIEASFEIKLVSDSQPIRFATNIQFKPPAITEPSSLIKLSFDVEKDLPSLPTTKQRAAYENFINSISQNRDLEYYWGFRNDNNSLSNNVLIVNDGQNIYTPDFIDDAVDYYSALFIIPASPCREAKTLIWKADDTNGEPIVTDPLFVVNDFCIRPILTSFFYLHELCNNNQQASDIIQFELLAQDIDPQSNLPFLVELYETTDTGLGDLLFSDTSPEFLPQTDGLLAYKNQVDIDTSSLIGAHHKYKLIMSDTSGNAESDISSIQLDTHIATNQISAPINNTLFCASDENTGAVNVNVAGQVSLSSPYKAQVHILINGSQLNENPMNYQGFNAFSELNQFFATVGVTQEIMVPQYSGPASLVLETFNASGVSYCSNTNIVIDSLVDFSDLGFPSLAQLSNQANYLSPNGDGNKDTLFLTTIQAHEALTVTLELYDLNDLVNALATVMSAQVMENERADFNWDGMLNGSTVVDGSYKIKVIISDECGLFREFKIPVTVDTTLPNSTFVTPIDGGDLSAIQRVVINTDESNLIGAAGSLDERITIDYNYNNLWNSLEVLTESFNSNGLYQVQLDWNLTNLPAASYPLRVRVEDLAGNIGSTIINPVLTGNQNLFWSFAVSPLFISPNADAVQDTASIDFGLNVAAIVSVNILDGNQTSVRNLVVEQTFSAQAQQLVFNGLDDNGEILNDGSYLVKIVASDASNLTNTATLQLPITLDNQEPVISWLQPLAAITKGVGLAQVRLDELHPGSFQVNNQLLDPLSAATTVLNEVESGVFDLFTLDELTESQYQLSASATDLAGNSTTAILSYLIDKTAPEISLINPDNNAFLGGQSFANITGSIADNNFDHYQLSLAANIEPFNWQTIYTDTILTDSVFAYQWPISANDGAYVLRLSAYDQAGWITHDIRAISIDQSAPQVQIDQPLTNTTVGVNTDIFGTASDENFDFYTLSYKLSTEPSWTIFKISQAAVISAKLGEISRQLGNGNYDIKLTAQDKSGLSRASQINITLDSQAPETPLNLTLERIAGNVSLQWSPVIDDNLSGYILFRNGEPLTAQALADTHYLDTALSDGQYVYTVAAVDSFGNVSQLSNQVTVSIDTTPPEILLISPTDNQRVRSSIAIIGSAVSFLDFNSYQLYYRQAPQPAPGTLFHQSSLAVTQDVLAVLDTTLLQQNQEYIIRLAALDNSNNSAFIEQHIFVDNSAPTAPLNLTQQLQGQNDVLLQWTANNESDLAGYLVFENGVVISGTGDGSLTIANATAETSFTATNLVDGVHNFTVAAIDQTGNVSAVSNTVSVTINSRAPDTLIISPVAAEKFESPIIFLAGSPDNDIAEIKFEYSTDNIIWNQLAIDQEQPFQTTINPVVLNLTFGNLSLRATATDRASQTDTSPAQITVEYADLTAPQAVENLSADINGGTITLSWDANNEPDLGGYIVYQQTNGIRTELTIPAITLNSYVLNNLADDNYTYQVVAVDHANNESPISQIDKLSVFSIKLEQPYSPLLSTTQIQLRGHSIRADGVIQTTQQNSMGTLQLTDIPLLTDNTFISPFINLDTGLNSFAAIQAVDSAHHSKSTTVQVELSPVPQTPANLQVNVVGFSSNLAWDTTPQTFGYLPYRNGTPVYPVGFVDTVIDYQASSNSLLSMAVGDNDLETYWYPTFDDVIDANPTFVELSFDQPKWVTGVELTWYDDGVSVFEPSAYSIQYLSAVGWISSAEISAQNQSQVSHATEIPYLTDKVRVLINNPIGSYEEILLAEIKVKQQPLISQNSVSLVEIDGNYSYQVSSINSYGFESALTNVVDVGVGDTTAPDTTTLNANIIGLNNIALSWDASISIDTAHYWLFRNDELIFISADETILNYTDTGLTNGQYRYHLRVVDRAGNTSINSNSISLDIQQQALPVPLNLSAFAMLEGSAAQLNWDVITAPRFHHYAIYRSVVSSGSYQKITDTIDNQLLDRGLENGTSYYYVVVSVDEFNNESAYSNEVVVTPIDSVPAPTPLITSPTVNGTPIVLSSLMTNISGISDPGVLVDLYLNDIYRRTVTTSTDYLVTRTNLIDIDRLRISAQGEYYAYTDFYGFFVVKSAVTGIEVSKEIFVDDFVWNKKGTRLYAILFDDINGNLKLASYDTNLNETNILFTQNNIISAVPAPDETKILYQGDYSNPQTGQTLDGLWLYDSVNSTAIAVPVAAGPDTNSAQIAWSNDSLSVAFINLANGGKLYLYNTVSQALTLIDTNFGSNNRLDWSTDNSSIIYDRDEFNPKLYIYNRINDTSTLLPNTSGMVKSGHYSPNGKQIVYQQDCCSIVVYDTTNQSSTVIDQTNATIVEMNWNKDHGIELFDQTQFELITSPGGFVFTDVVLEFGDNRLHVIARDGSGIPSLPSLPINISIESTGLPDLEINPADLLVSPTSATAGANFVASVIVSNNSDQTILNAELRVNLSMPDGSNEVISIDQNQISLQAFSSQSVFIDIGTRSMVGEYVLQVLIDAQNQITESNENNNSAYQTLRVLENLDPTLQMFVTPELLAPNQTLAIAFNVFNPAENFNGSISLNIRDENGFPVTNQLQYAITDLAHNTSVNITDNWDTSAVFSGSYQLEAQLIAENGRIIQQQHRQIELQSFAQFQLTLDVANSTISVNDGLQFSADINYSNGNIPQNATLTWKILNNNQQLIWSRVTTMPLMLPGFSTVLNSQWQATDAGDYMLQLQFNASNDQQTLIQPFNVIAAEQTIELGGQIANTPTNIILADNFSVDYTLDNLGDIDLNDIPVTIKLISADTFEDIFTSTRLASIATNQSTVINTAITSQALNNQNYLLALYADLSSIGQSPQQLLDTRSIFAIDRTAPEITISAPLAGSLNPANLDLRFRVSDLHGQVTAIQLQSTDINQGVALDFNINNINQQYQLPLFNLSDGTHQINFVVSDNFGNNRQKTLSFNVDAITPDITITGIIDNQRYNHSVSASVNINDANLIDSQILLNGEIITANHQISAEGNYFLLVSAEDAVGNRSTESRNFSIDLSAPVVNIAFPANNAEIGNSTTAVIGTTEALSTVTLSKTGYQASTQSDINGDFSFADVPLQIGVNSMTIQAQDLANNLSQAATLTVTAIEQIEVQALLDIPVVIPIEQDMQVNVQLTNQSTNNMAGLAIRIQLFDTIASTLIDTQSSSVDLVATQSLNQTITFSTASLIPEKYQLILSLFIDNQWQIKDQKFIGLADTTPPEINIGLPILNQVYNSNVNAAINVNDQYSAITEVSYQLDNSTSWQQLVNSSADNYIASLQLNNGNHSIRYRARDKFDNSQQSQDINFVVDTIAPQINIISPDDGSLTNQDVLIQFEISDDHHYQQQVELNGNPVSSGDIISAQGQYQLNISATDEVDNSTHKSIQFIIDKTAPALTISNLSDNQQIEINDISIKGSSEAHANISLTYDQVQLNSSANAQAVFEFSDVHLNDGDNELIFIATDQAGNNSPPVTIKVHFSNIGSCNIFGLKAATPYNVLTFADYQAQSASVGGRIAAGHDIFIDDYTIGQQLSLDNAGDVLIASANIDFAQGQVFYGNILAAAQAHIGQTVIDNMHANAEIIENANLPIDFDEAYHDLSLFSAALSQLPENTTHSTVNGQLTLQGQCSSSMQIYNLEAKELTNSRQISIACIADNAYVIINVRGAIIRLQNLDMTALSDLSQYLIINFYQAQQISLNNSIIAANILAIHANINNQTSDPDVIFSHGFDDAQNNVTGTISGQTIAQSWHSNVQLNHKPLTCSDSIQLNSAPIISNLQLQTEMNTPLPLPLAAIDENQATLVYQLLSQPESGQLTGTLPNLIYVPENNRADTVTFDYQVTDQQGQTSSATVDITVLRTPR
jgi:choice-of-anchor A domain-containing protein